MDRMFEAQGQRYWCEDWDVKYLNLRIDTRDLGFILTEADGRGHSSNMKNRFRICPSKVITAIDKWNDRIPTNSGEGE